MNDALLTKLYTCFSTGRRYVLGVPQGDISTQSRHRRCNHPFESFNRFLSVKSEAPIEIVYALYSIVNFYHVSTSSTTTSFCSTLQTISYTGANKISDNNTANNQTSTNQSIVATQRTNDSTTRALFLNQIADTELSFSAQTDSVVNLELQLEKPILQQSQTV